MTTPTAVFLDTSILAGQQFNFASNSISTFIPVAKKYELTFLLPDPTEREVLRQIDQRAKEALEALNEARKKAPFLHKWSGFPKPKSNQIDNWEVTRVAKREWHTFLSNFNVARLGYDHLNIYEVMDWYDKCEPPFKEGKKRKEFPDAFAVSILKKFAQKNNLMIAVVSGDQDFKDACSNCPNLLYFNSLPRLTQLLLSSDNQLEIVQAAIDSEISELESSIIDALEYVSYSHESSSIEIRSSNILSLRVQDHNIVAIGDNEFTVTFDCEFEVEHTLEWDTYRSDLDVVSRESSSVIETYEVQGLAKVSLNLSETTKPIEVINVVLDSMDFDVSDRSYDFW